MKHLSLFVFAFMLLNIGYASNKLTLTDKSVEYDVSNYLSYFIDSSKTLTIDEVVANDHLTFIENTKSPVNLGVKVYPVWFKFDLINPLSNVDWVLELKYPTLNKVTFYIIDYENKVDTVIYSGKDHFDENGNTYSYSIFFHLPIQTGKDYRIYFQIDTESFMILPVTIRSIPIFFDYYRKELTHFNLLYGLFIAFVVFNLMLFVLTRERSYLILTLYLLSLSINAYFMHGYGFNLFPRIDVFYASRMRHLLFGIGSILFLTFTINYLDLKKYKALYRIILFLIIVCVIYSLVLLFKNIPQSFFTQVSIPLFSLGAILCFYAGVRAFIKGERLAVYYIVSFVFITVASVIYSLTLFGILPFNNFTFNINLFGTLLFSLLLTIGLIEKITAIKQERIKSQLLESMVGNLNVEINERKKVEKALRESESRFRLLFEMSPQPISLTEVKSGRFIDINRQMEDFFGFSKKEAIDKTTLELNIITVQTRNRMISKLKTDGYLSGFELQLRHKSGKISDGLAYMRVINIMGADILISVFIDVTELKQKQQENRKLLLALNQSSNSIIITDLDGLIEFVNSSFVALTGYCADELIGKKPSILKSGVHSDDFYNELWKTIKNGRTWSGEFNNKKKNGELFWDRTTISPVFDEKGEMLNFIAVKEDFTDRKLKNELLVKSEKELRVLNASKDKFFSIIGHDLMNPFNAMMGFIQLLIDSSNEDDKDKCFSYLMLIDQSSKRIFNLLQNLLLWSKTQSHKVEFRPAYINVVELLMNSIDILKSEAYHKKIEIVPEIMVNENVYADDNMISVVIRNLVSNAIKFSEKGDKVFIKFQKNENNLIFSIADQGSGIEPERLKALFGNLNDNELSGQEEVKLGFGLGLILCSEFIKMHNGHFWAVSELGKGSTFFFTLPVVHS